MSRNIYFGSLEEDREFVADSQGIKVADSKIEIVSGVKESKPAPTNEEFERRSLARSLRIPTDDPSVRRLLVALNQPVTLFGEGPAERRDRLRLMASRAICSLPRALELFPVLKTLMGQETAEQSEEEEDDSEEFYVPGSIDLIKIRSFLLEDSINRSQAQNRCHDQVKEQAQRSALYRDMAETIDLKASFMDSQGRPLSACKFTSDGKFFTGDWQGRVMSYSEGASNCLSASAQDRITALESDSSQGILIGTAAGKIIYKNHVLSLPSTHAIKSLNWHPSDRFFASASSDSLWRLWDAETGAELQVQEGHLGGVGAGTWHPHGAIYCTGGASDGLIRVWDCRLGKSIWNIAGKPAVAITSLAFAPLTPNLLASANADGLISLHDLRKVEAEYAKVAAHRSCCSALRFTAGGRILASAGFDGSVRLWCPGDFRLIKELPVSSSKVTDFDVWQATGDNEVLESIKIGAVTFDRSVKIFSNAK